MNPSPEQLETLWIKPNDASTVQIIDQRQLPHRYVVHDLKTPADGAFAIREMLVRGAPLIGATAAWSLYLAARTATAGNRIDAVRRAATLLTDARPTAVNLRWATDRMLTSLHGCGDDEVVSRSRAEAQAICDQDADMSRRIGEHGLTLLEDIAERKRGAAVNVLTHCNAGALATVKWGTATAPLYFAQQKGIPIHVWVDETRPRNQGSLTAWELAAANVPHTLIVDNAGGHLMQHGEVDICIVGTDRTTRDGDVANKVGTYLKALAANDNGLPFYVALPSTTIDWSIADGLESIPIEQREAKEVTHTSGLMDGEIATVSTVAPDTQAANYAFDVTPARLVTGLITERGICAASAAGLSGLFPEAAARIAR